MGTENNDKKGWDNFKEKLQNTYRLVVMNDESFEEIGSYKLSLLNLYIAISAATVLVAFLVFSIIFFTPIKRLVPGYGDASSGELREIYQKNIALEEKLKAQKTYTDSFRRMITGDDETEEDVKSEEIVEVDSLQTVTIIEEDEILRQEVEEEVQSQQKQKLGSISASSNEMPLEQLYFIPPITGVVSEQFMPDKKHYGTDILAPKNTPVKATLDGFVISSDWTLETGNTISIQHSNNLISFYKHNSALLKEIGNSVKAGEAVAIIGNTGTLSDGPHLHFELWHKGKPINPEDFITFE
ncbi:MAG: M23 family metallopeptidase [Saprospiraceae bacterium]|nr:M23 family metallopeptidase [Saprospiraceae bacterium]MDG1433406.1 M23 family metallopeptidase [Saprospiraceae bacterium]MDG2419811.1 M23 family metallopeptidase [Saprospiraceae bacterium]